jgi:hypothetical protein
VSVDAAVAHGARQLLSFAVHDVLARFGIPVSLGKTKVNHTDPVCLLPDAHAKVVGLDVAMNKVLGMHEFDATQLRRNQYTLATASLIFRTKPLKVPSGQPASTPT